MKEYIKRPHYLKKIAPFIDKNVIKSLLDSDELERAISYTR